MKAKKILIISLLIAILGGLGFGNYECIIHEQEITTHLIGTGETFDAVKAQTSLNNGDEVVQAISEEGMVLLKNNGALPLSMPQSGNYKLNLFGTGSTNASYSRTQKIGEGGFVYTGRGSGSATIRDEDITDQNGNVVLANKVTLQAGLEAAGFEVNEGLLAAYEKGPLGESFYTSDGTTVLKEAKAYSDTAVVTISRYTGENQGAAELTTETDGRNFLQLTANEEYMMNYVCENYEHVIVLINCANIMEMGFLQDERIDAALLVSYPGQSGTKAIGKILSGEVNPSARLADTVPYDSKDNPTWANVIQNVDSSNTNGQIAYVEDIYFGYRWYETADTEGYFNNVNNEYGQGYNGVVQYPFGYGLSYTTFSWEVEDVTWIVDDEESAPPTDGVIDNYYTEFQIKVKVTNTGDYAGKDVVELYYTPPYYKGEIEKSSINLLAFAKTGILQPDESETVTLSFDVYDLASYDCYDKNQNGISGYEVDPGEYSIKLMQNAHTKADCEGAEMIYTVEDSGSAGGRRGFVFRFDPDTKQYVKNRFTGDTAEAGVPIDGSTAGTPITYLSRANFSGTFPTTRASDRTGTNLTTANSYYYTGWDDLAASGELTAPALGQSNNLYLYTLEGGGKASAADLLSTSSTTIVPNENLIMELGSDYDSEKWDLLLSQLTIEDINTILNSGGFGTLEAESIGKPQLIDRDGPSGFNYDSSGSELGPFTGYGAEVLLACTWNTELAYEMGAALGKEASDTVGFNGLYAPCVNLHRTAYNTRNFEAYSEDGVLSGYMAANVITGAKNNGLTMYLKHLALSEAGQNPRYLNTWITEQNFREVYLKPFEIAVKEGNANAVMSSYNRIGGIWSGNSYALFTQILRNEWGFRGSVVTDYGVGSVSQMVRSGNDLKFNVNRNTYISLGTNNVASVYCGVQAIKNTLYTFCNTYYTAKTYDPEVTISIVKTEVGFRWWIVALIVLDVLVVLTVIISAIVVLKPKKGGEEEDDPMSIRLLKEIRDSLKNRE
jgi:beta-glucosidase